MNCLPFHKHCHAECCSDSAPLPRDLITRFADKVINAPIEIIEDKDEVSVFENEEPSYLYKTAMGICMFLNTDYSCNIYESRPTICRKFGDETHPFLCCTVQTKDGHARSKQSKKRVQREQQKYANRFNIFMQQMQRQERI